MQDPSTLTLRAARTSDCTRLLEWVNSPDSLAAKLKTHAPIASVEHVRWFERAMADNDIVIYIVESDGSACGQIRFTRQFDNEASTAPHWLVDIFVCDSFRGAGVARSAMEKAMHRLLLDKRHTFAAFVAEVIHENPASLSLFHRLGFTSVANTKTHVCLMKNVRRATDE